MFSKVLVANRGRDRRARDPRARRARHRLRRGLLRGRPRRAARPARDRGVPARARARPRESYLVVDKLLEVIEQSGAEAVHPGYGFLAENAAFAQRLEEAGRHVHRPARVGDRGDGLQDPRARADAGGRRADRPGHHRAGRDVEAAAKIAEEIGYPIAVKAAGGGGGKGFRVALDARQARGRLRGRRARGREVLLRRDGLPRALPARPAPRRGPGARRRRTATSSTSASATARSSAATRS